MLPVFSKQIEAIDKEDIEQLIKERFPEGSMVEYKEELPNKRGRDPWYDGKSQLGERARNSILTEVIAFSNAHGGHVFLGIEQSNEEPPRATGKRLIPRCAELAEKIRLQARDCIEPKLSVLSAWGIEFDSDGAGIVLIRVPQSRNAPHRLNVKSKRECYIRRADRSEPMSMREIQDLTLQRDRGLDLVNAKFAERRKLFQERFTAANPSYQHEYQLRATLIPVSAEPWIDDIYRNPELSPITQSLEIEIEGGKHPLNLLQLHYQKRPILGGLRYYYGTKSNEYRYRIEIMRNGTIEYAMLAPVGEKGNPALHPEWVLCIVANSLLMAQKFRGIAGLPDVEYGLEFEISRTSWKTWNLCRLGVNKFHSYQDHEILGEIEHNPLQFERYSVGDIDEFNRIISLIFRDLVNAAGIDWNANMEVNFRS